MQGSSKLKDNNNTLPLENKEHSLTEKEEAYKKYRQLLNYEDVSWKLKCCSVKIPINKLNVMYYYLQAPKHLQFNPFIRKGYRNMLPSKMCLQSVFWFTNETVNIWSHVFGLFLFLALFINDVAFLKSHATFVDKIIIGVLLISFSLCMCFSSLVIIYFILFDFWNCICLYVFMRFFLLYINIVPYIFLPFRDWLWLLFDIWFVRHSNKFIGE